MDAPRGGLWLQPSCCCCWRRGSVSATCCCCSMAATRRWYGLQREQMAPLWRLLSDRMEERGEGSRRRGMVALALLRCWWCWWCCAATGINDAAAETRRHSLPTTRPTARPTCCCRCWCCWPCSSLPAVTTPRVCLLHGGRSDHRFACWSLYNTRARINGGAAAAAAAASRFSTEVPRTAALGTPPGLRPQ